MPFRIPARFNSLKCPDEDPGEALTAQYLTWLRRELATGTAYYDANFRPSPDLDKPIDTLELSVRARRGLLSKNIATVAQLVENTADDLLELRNFGITSVMEVRSKLAQRRLALKGESPRAV